MIFSSTVPSNQSSNIASSRNSLGLTAEHRESDACRSRIGLAEDDAYIHGKQWQKGCGAFLVVPTQKRRRQVCPGLVA
jgi:hypothetical protein